jgi:sulfotransferase
MLNKNYIVVAGLPRAGSTLLCNLLAQNPRFQATPTSGCLDVIFGVRNNWDKLIEHQSAPDKAEDTRRRVRVLRSILNAYHETDRPVIIEKSRGWLAHLELLARLTDAPPKVLVPVRDLRGCLASFEKLHRRKVADSQPRLEADRYFDFQTVIGRCRSWMLGDQPIGLAVNRIQDALQRGFRNCIHFVPFSQLTSDPTKTLAGIYEFLGEPAFQHNPEHVEQVTHEDDSVHGFDGLHTIRTKVEHRQEDYISVLGNECSRIFSGPYCWDSQ